MNRRLITSSVIAILLIGSVILGIKAWQNYRADEYIKEGASNQEILNSIVHDKPSFIYKGKPFIEITSVKRFEDIWYVATIKSPKDTDMKVPVKIILEDIRTGNEKRILKVKLGPDTHFTDYKLLQYPLPDSLMKELKR